MLDVIKKLFGDKNKKLIDKKYQPFVVEIKAHEQAVRNLSDDGLRAKTETFKEQIHEAVAGIEARQEEIRTLDSGNGSTHVA